MLHSFGFCSSPAVSLLSVDAVVLVVCASVLQGFMADGISRFVIFLGGIGLLTDRLPSVVRLRRVVVDAAVGVVVGGVRAVVGRGAGLASSPVNFASASSWKICASNDAEKELLMVLSNSGGAGDLNDGVD